MRLNQRLQQLGVKRLAHIVHQSNARKKSKNRDDHGQRVARGASSKRVLAPDHLEQTRCTRQSLAREKAAAALIPVEATEVPPPDSTSIQNEEGMDITEEGTLTAYTQVEQRGLSMGIELDSITRGLRTRIPVVIKEGKRRPEAPMQAAKLASEGGIIIRQHIPIYTSWKEYKDELTKANWTTSKAN